MNEYQEIKDVVIASIRKYVTDVTLMKLNTWESGVIKEEKQSYLYDGFTICPGVQYKKEVSAMTIEGCSKYNLAVHIHMIKKDCEFSYRYRYQNHDFEGRVVIRDIPDPEWLRAVFQVILENEIEQYELDMLAEREIGG